MQALAEARMPDEFRSWWEAVEWITGIEGCSGTEALRRLAVKIAHGDVQAVNGYLTPLSRGLFPYRMIALTTNDVRPDVPLERRILISWEDLLKVWPPRSPEPTTAADETRAIALLKERLEADKHMTRERAFEACRERFPTLSERGFRSRVWPEARKAAGLDPKARSGRKRTAKTQSS
jgi:hypothetical protein